MNYACELFALLATENEISYISLKIYVLATNTHQKILFLLVVYSRDVLLNINISWRLSKDND